jgi:hypothetical protein
MRRRPTAPVNVARISVATSATDFTAPEAYFAALIRAAGFCPGEIILSRGNCGSQDSAWSARERAGHQHGMNTVAPRSKPYRPRQRRSSNRMN